MVELTKPLVTSGRVSFAMRPIPQGTVAGQPRGDDLEAGRFDRARLFIDDEAIPL